MIITAEKNITIVNPNMSVDKIQSYLKESRGMTKFSKGIYNITKTLYLYSDSTILLDGATLIRKAGCSVFMTYADSNTTKYNGQKNINLSGGMIIANASKKISNVISMVHAKNITINGLTINKNSGSHAIEINSSNNVTIAQCTFDGNVIDPKNPYREIIQLDFSYYGGLNYATSKSAKCYDDTACSFVTIQNCLFKAVNVCIGTHTQTMSSKKHSNIKLLNNKAYGIGAVNGYGSCFKLMNFKDVLIEGNIISGFARGIDITSSNRFYSSNGSATKTKPPYITGCKDVVIQGNTINDSSSDYAASGIFTTSKFNDLNHENIEIKDNTFRLNNKAAKYDIYLRFVSGATIADNDTKLKISVDKDTTNNVKVI